MELVLFTKMFRGLTLEETASHINDLGFDGVDLLIREGHQLEPGAPQRIPDAVRLMRTSGLSVPMATTDLTDPHTYLTEQIFSSCREAGIRLIRLGYWMYDPRRGFSECFAQAEHDVDAFVRLAEKTGVQLAIQLHGGTIHNSGSLTAKLLAGYDPAFIAAYPDPGNQAIQDGREDWRMTFDLLTPWLGCVGIKNGGWFPAEVGRTGQRHWRSDWLGLSDGMVPWDEIIPFLIESGFDGLLSFHSHYEVPLAQALDQTRSDLRFIRQLIEFQAPVILES